MSTTKTVTSLGPSTRLTTAPGAAIDSVLEKHATRSPGGIGRAAFFAVDAQGRTLYERAIGDKSLDGSEKLQPDSIFWTASISKFMTALASMIAVEKELLTLDTDLRQIVPYLKKVQILEGFDDEAGGIPRLRTCDRPITLKQCLTHTNGFTYDMWSKDLQRWAEYVGKKETALGGSMKGYEYPLIFNPGHDWKYGPGMDWAGRAVEILTGQSLEEFMRINIWGKLGMTNTSFRPARDPALMSKLVEVGFRANPKEPKHSTLRQAPFSFPADAEDCCGGVGIFSSPADIRKLMTSMLVHKGAPVIERTSYEQIMSNQLGDPADFLNVVGNTHHESLGQQWPKSSQGSFGLSAYLLESDVEGRRRKGTVSWQGMPGCFMWMDRESGIAAGFMTQVLPPGDPVVQDCLLEAEEALYQSLSELRKAVA